MGGSAGVVGVGMPLTRWPTLFPGQMGVPGTDSEEGLRLSTTGAVFYVDCNYPGAHDSRDGTNPSDPLLTIQAAVNKCEDYRNDVILVAMNGAWQYGPQDEWASWYQEAVTLDKHGVRMIGVGPSSIGVPWGPATALGTCLTVTAIDCIVEGFLFTGQTLGGDGIYVEWDGTDLWGENVVIRHCTFDGDIDTAIAMEFVWYAAIHDCFFQECDEYGIYVDPAGSGIAYSHIYNNWFKDCTSGALSLRGCDDSKIEGNNIFDTSAEAAAVATDQGIDTTGGSANIVAHNTMSCVLPVAANGDYDDFCTSAATDAWIQNYLLNGPSVTNPT